MGKSIGWIIATLVDFILIFVLSISVKKDYRNQDIERDRTVIGKVLIIYTLAWLGMALIVTAITSIIS